MCCGRARRASGNEMARLSAPRPSQARTGAAVLRGLLVLGAGGPGCPSRCNVERRQRIAQRIRQLGLKWVVFGSDVSNPHGRPGWNWDQVLQLFPLTKDEFATIASNVTPYLAATR
jgi:hypothetical protein